jgi:hypothetical protein
MPEAPPADWYDVVVGPWVNAEMLMLTTAGFDTVTVTRPVSDEAAKAPSCVLWAVTVMVAVPAATAVITPVAETVAIAGALVPYVIVAAAARGPCALAVTDCVPPTVRAAVAGDTCKEVKPGARSDTVIVAAVVIEAAANPVPVPAAVTVMVVVPGATAVTMPAAETVATAAVDDV